ncbi:MAG TPA: tetratricopeptide repeat protein, partial [Thermoanaerobaculia bacterium]|nr:tetratricopeptide repeat protein [Thermoanaerobaculia bacterium]
LESGRIVVDEGSWRWQAESGQGLLDFDGASSADAPVTEFARRPEDEPESREADGWFERACELEADSPLEARAAYERAIDLDPAHAEAHVNLGRLLHEAQDPAAAAEHYRAALDARPGDGTAAFNLGVAYEDLGLLPEALLQYQEAVRFDPANADGHYNAAALAERLGRPAEAVRHLKAFRLLTRGRAPE